MLLSIIIPLYNAEKYIEKSIRSILKQCETFNDVEIVVINDGSTDNSYNIVSQICQKTEKLKLYNQENKGEGFTRNIGLEKANGKFIGFVDADDYIDGDILQRIHSLLVKDEEIEIIIYGMKKVTEDGYSYPYVEFKDETTTPQKLIENKVFSNSVCNKIFKASTIKSHQIKFNTAVKTATDFDFSFRMLYCSKKVKTLSGLNYNYMTNLSSVSNIRTKKHLIELADHSVIVANELKDFLKKKANVENNPASFKAWHDNFLYGLLLSLFRFNYDKETIYNTLFKLKQKNNYPIISDKLGFKKKLFLKIANRKELFVFICKIKRIFN